MKNKLFTVYGKKLISFALFLTMIVSVLCGSVSAQSNIYTAGDMEKIIDGIAAWKMEQAKSDTIQKLIDNGLAPYAGMIPTEWYIVAFHQYKNSYKYTSYISALNKYSDSTASKKATDLQRIAIAYSAVGSNSDFISSTINGTIGKLGVMSYIYGLILLDSGAYKSTVTDRNTIIGNILSLEMPDGGWALTGKMSDIDITAMAIQALAPYYQFSDVKSAVDKALNMLSKQQQENGDYKSWGTRNAESTAQVIAALSALGRNCQTDSRFIKNGKTLIDGLLCYRLPDGSFSHLLGGTSNDTSSVQAMISLIAAWRQSKGLGAFYKFTGKSIAREVNTPTGSHIAVSAGTSQTDYISAGNQRTTSPQETAASLAKSTSASDAANITTKPADIRNPSQATSPSAAANTKNTNTANRYKCWAYGFIALLALLAIVLLLIKKKCNIKNILLVIVLTAASLLAVLFSKVQTVDEYYLVHIDDIKPDSRTVFISIRCDTVAGKKKAAYIPSDGYILKKTEYVLRDGDTVFDILVRAAKHNKIPIEYTKGNIQGATYIKGIQYLYEYDYGENSGWMYKINGKFDGIGCSDRVLSDGDDIEWVYTCDLGKDVGG